MSNIQKFVKNSKFCRKFKIETDEQIEKMNYGETNPF